MRGQDGLYPKVSPTLRTPGDSKRITVTADPRLLARFDGKAGRWRRIRDLRFLKPVSEVVFVDIIFVSLPEEPNNEVGHQPHDGGNDQHRQQLAHGCVPSKAQEVAYHMVNSCT